MIFLSEINQPTPVYEKAWHVQVKSNLYLEPFIKVTSKLMKYKDYKKKLIHNKCIWMKIKQLQIDNNAITMKKDKSIILIKK